MLQVFLCLVPFSKTPDIIKGLKVQKDIKKDITEHSTT